MKVIFGLTHFKVLNKKPVVALGVFDGLHCGHQKIIANLLQEAKRLKTSSLIVTFFPHPQREKSLYSLSQRLKLLEEAGVDLCLVIRFSSAFRKMPAREFLKNILIKKIKPATVFIGRNFTYGRNAEGNWQKLKDYSKVERFKLRVINVLTYKGIPVSSSYIRSLIRTGNLSRAQKLLGQPVGIAGRVTKGSNLGRILGYPTANINPHQKILPPFGVYGVRVGIGGKLFAGICYIGNKPTINAARNIARKTNIEVHIFDFKNNLYSRKIQIEFIKKIRNQKRFSSIKALSCQIKKDIRLCLK